LPPAREDAVHGRAADDWPWGHLEVGRVEDERPGLDTERVGSDRFFSTVRAAVAYCLKQPDADQPPD
jgi:hypothetical protein